MARTFPALGLAGRRHRAERRRGAALALPRLQNALVEPKAVSMPPEHGVGLHDDECVSPAGPQAAEPRPEQPVDGPQPRAPAGLSLQDRQLMS